jgi:hypothetical protein
MSGDLTGLIVNPCFDIPLDRGGCSPPPVIALSQISFFENALALKMLTTNVAVPYSANSPLSVSYPLVRPRSS